MFAWEVGSGVAGWGAIIGSLDAAEDGGGFAFELEEVEVDDGAAGVEDDVDWGGEVGEGGADGFAEAAFDAIAVDRSTEGFGDGKADPGAGSVAAPVCWAQGVEVGDLFGELLAAGLVDQLVVSVFAEAVRGAGVHEVHLCLNARARPGTGPVSALV